MNVTLRIALTFAFILLPIFCAAAPADFVQQGAKLVGTGASGGAQQGAHVSFSANGDTAIVVGAIQTWVWTWSGGVWSQQTELNEGGSSATLSGDGNTAIIGIAGVGASVWTRSGGGSWTRQGPHLVASDTLGSANQGASVSLSADGNTAIIGGDRDNNFAGAAWVWTRSGGVWSQQAKLIASGTVGSAQQGFSVCLAADGNTAIVGAPNNDSQAGAAWVWTRNGADWVQQSQLLSSTTGRGFQGYSVSLSADGNTAVVGAPATGNGVGEVRVWIRAAGVWTQRSEGLIGSSPEGSANQGNSVSISADGNTVIVGGSGDASGVGAAWVWTRGTGVWTQQGAKLVGAGSEGNAGQGTSVSLTADGNSAIIGGPYDGADGAAWVWIRDAGGWAQEGNKLKVLHAKGRAGQGWSVALSADGNTAIIGGPNDNDRVGAAWVWTRSAGVWTQQGDKLVGTGPGAALQQGWSVALSADGNTAVVGGPGGYSDGAAYVWTRNDGRWTQQGNPLVGSGAIGFACQGASVAISADGNTVIVGGHCDNGNESRSLNTGAAWVWTRSSGVWTQQGPKLVATDNVIGKYGSYQGYSVSLSANGDTAIIGGPEDDSQIGAAWIWTRSGGLWTQQGPKLVGSAVPGLPAQGNSVSLSGDGNMALIGAANKSAGAWVWTRTGGIWSEQNRLETAAQTVGGFATQGGSVSLSSDGNTAVVGGFPYQGDSPAALVWTRSAGGLWTKQTLFMSGAAGTTGAFSVAISADGRTAIAGGAQDNAAAGASWVFALPSPPRRRAVRH